MNAKYHITSKVNVLTYASNYYFFAGRSPGFNGRETVVGCKFVCAYVCLYNVSRSGLLPFRVCE